MTIIPSKCKNLNFGTVTYELIQLLKEYPATRNSDKLLLEKYYAYFEGLEIPLSKVNTTPSTIIRLRKLIQNRNPLLRSSPTIQEAKENLAEDFRKEMGVDKN